MVLEGSVLVPGADNFVSIDLLTDVLHDTSYQDGSAVGVCTLYDAEDRVVEGADQLPWVWDAAAKKYVVSIPQTAPLLTGAVYSVLAEGDAGGLHYREKVRGIRCSDEGEQE
jgi:hypothetical protein